LGHPIHLQPAVSPSRLAPSTQKLQLHLVFTGLATARAALAAATGYARGLGAQITILVTQVVPYPLPLEEPPVDLRLLERDLRALAADPPVETTIQIYLCRDRWETIRNALPRESTVIVGGRKCWWRPSTEQRLARLLRRDGHRVILNLQSA
jgi:hypothetical protein